MEILRHFALGDKYAPMIANGIKMIPNTQFVGLSDNRLSHIGANILLPNISYETRIIDMSNNKIGKDGCLMLYKIITDRRYRYIRRYRYNINRYI